MAFYHYIILSTCVCTCDNFDLFLVFIVSILLEGCLEAYVYTASRYNKCRILQIPFVSADIQFHFITHGDSYGHHSVIRCLHDELPLLPNGQVHVHVHVFVLMLLMRSICVHVWYRIMIHTDHSDHRI